MSEIKEIDLYNAFKRFTTKLSASFQKSADAIAKRNVVEKWAEFSNLFDILLGKLSQSSIEIPNESILTQLLIELGSSCMNVDESILIEKYFELESCMIEPSKYPRVWCFLYPFSCALNEIDFSGPLRIRKATLLERASQQQYKPTMKPIANYIVETKQGFVQSVISSDKDNVDKGGSLLNVPSDPPMGDDFFSLITILRLVRPSPIGYDSLILQEETPEVSYKAVYNVSPWKQPCLFGVIRHIQLSLSREDIDELNQLWDDYDETTRSLGKEQSARLERALRRYEMAICSNEIEDAVVDSIIAFETLFEVGGKAMTHRASNLIGSTEKAVRLTKDILEKARDMRNYVVHGETAVNSYEHVNKYLLQILRHVLVSAIVLSKNGDWFADIISDSISRPTEMRRIKKSISKWLIK